MRNIHVEIHAQDLRKARNQVDAEQMIYLKLAEKGIPIDAGAFLRRELKVTRGLLDWAYHTVEEKWVIDWTEEVKA